MFYQYDKDGFFLQQTVNENAENITLVAPLDGLFKPKFNGYTWEEGADQEYIENMTKKDEKPIEDMKLLKDSSAFLIMQMLTSENAMLRSKLELAEARNKLEIESKLNSKLLLELVKKGVI